MARVGNVLAVCGVRREEGIATHAGEHREDPRGDDRTQGLGIGAGEAVRGVAT
jgi:hypothetical protein